MRALTFLGPRSIGCESVADPAIERPTDALVEIRLSGICGSDLHVYHERERGIDLRTVMGHEFIGEVVDIGSEVRTLRKGQLVLSPFTTSCGDCFFCREGLTARCRSGQLFGWVEGGAGLHGAQAELIRVPLADGTLVPIPEGVGDEEALLLGDVLSTGYYCALRAAAAPGDTYAVVGCGPVGLMAIVAACELHAGRVFAVDSVPERLELALRLGAEPIDRSTTDPAEVLREATGGRGADAVLEAVGSPGAGRTAMDLVRPGGTVSVVGVHNEQHFSFSPAEAYDKNLTLRVGRCPARAMLEATVPLVQRGKYELASIISHRLPLSDGPEAYRIFDTKQDGCTKVVLRTDRS